MTEGMQYRTKNVAEGEPSTEWGDWKWLTASLTFSNFYRPTHFEFRWWNADDPTFMRQS